MVAAPFAEIMNRHNVGMVQSRQRTGFALETLGELGMTEAAERSRLQREAREWVAIMVASRKPRREPMGVAGP